MDAPSEGKTPENTTLRKALSIVQRLQGELLAHQEQKSRLELEVNDLRRKNHHLETSQKRLQGSLLDAERRRRELEDKWDEERQRLMSQVADRDDQLRAEERLRHREELRSRAGTDVEHENLVLRERCRVLETELERIGRSSDEKRDKADELQSELDRLRVNMVKLYAKYQKAQKPDERQQQAIKLLQEENLEQKRRLRVYARKYKDMKERLQQFGDERVKELEATIH